MSGHLSLLASTVLPGHLLGDVPPAVPGPAPVGFRLGDPGRPAPFPTLLIAVCDDSGSVTSPAGSDPLSNRYAEVTEAFRVVARRGAAHELGAVAHFDTPSSGDAGPVPLTRRGLLVLRRGLRVPPDGAGSSELAASLHAATSLAVSYPDHQTTLVVLSDFALLDPDPGLVLADLAKFPGDVHAVVLGRALPAGVFDERITVTEIGRDGPPGAVARALFTSLTVHRTGSSTRAPNPGERKEESTWR